MMRKMAAMTAAALLLLWAVPAMGDEPGLTGVWTYDEEASDDVVAAFEPALEEMGRVRRAVARRVLRREVEPEETTRIDIDDETVTVGSGDDPPLVAPVDGETVDHENDDGDDFRLRVDLDASTLTVWVTGDDTDFRSRYRLGDDGTRLDVEIRVDADELSQAVRYDLVYQRR